MKANESGQDEQGSESIRLPSDWILGRRNAIKRLRLLVLTVASITVLAACSGPAGPDGGGPPPSGECAVTITEDITIPTRLVNLGGGCDYLVDGDLRVTGALVIDAGTELQFTQDARWRIEDTGSINAVGTEDDQITLRGAVNTTGFWYGLCFSDNRASRFEWVNLLNAGKVWLGGSSVCRAAIGHGSGSGEPIAIVDTLVAGSQTTGLDATQLNLGEFARNAFAANEEYGVRVSGDNLQQLDSASDYIGTSFDAPNAKPYVHLADSSMSDPGETHVWPRLNAPYFIGEDVFGYHRNVIVADGTHVEIGPGTTFLFGGGGSLNIWDNSTLTARGTAAEPVVFTGLVQEPGSWDGIAISTGAVTFDHVEVSWGGADYFYPANLAIYGVDTSQDSFLSNTLFQGSAECGLLIGSGAHGHVRDNGTLAFEENVYDICG